MSATEAPEPIAIGETVEVPLNMTMLTDPDQIVEYERVSFDPADEAIATYESSGDRRSIRITGMEAGETTVAIRAGKGNLSGRYVLPVTVYDPEETAAENYLYTISKINTNQKLDTVTNFNMTTAGGTGELNPTKATAPWKYEGSADGAEFVAYSPDSYGALLGESAGTSLRIRVPKSGRYKMISLNWKQNEGGALSVYLTRADGTGPYARKTLLKSFDTYSEENEEDMQRRTLLGSVELLAGDYIVTYANRRSGGSGAARSAIAGLLLMQPEEPVSMQAKVKASQLVAKGASLSVPLDIQFTDGMDPQEAEDFVVTAMPQEQGIVEATVVKDAGGVKLHLTGLEEGSTRLDLSVQALGLSAAASITVDVVEQAGGSEARSLNYDFMKTNTGETKDIAEFTSFDTSVAAKSDPWKYGGMTGGFFRYAGTKAYGMYMQGLGSYSLILSVPASGNYRARGGHVQHIAAARR